MDGLTGSGRSNGPRRARRRTPLVGGLIVLGLAAAFAVPGALALRAADRDPTAAPTAVGPGSLPDRITDLPGSPADVAGAPSGRAALVLGLGSTGFFDISGRPAVLGADGDLVRTVAVSEESADGFSASFEAAALSPDGTRVALPAVRDGESAVEVLDLTTGDGETYGAGVLGVPTGLSWSPDGSALAVVHAPDDLDFRVDLLTLADGGVRTVLARVDSTPVAFAPDGRTLAVQEASGISVVDLDGGGRRQIPTGQGQFLAGRHAWSPDGRRIALLDCYDYCELSLADARPTADPGSTGDDAVVTYSGADSDVALLGWAGSGEMVVTEYRYEDGVTLLRSVDIGSGRTTDLARIEDSRVWTVVDVAADVLAGGAVRSVGDWDGGPPPPLRGRVLVGLGAAVLLLGSGLVALIAWLVGRPGPTPVAPPTGWAPSGGSPYGYAPYFGTPGAAPPTAVRAPPAGPPPAGPPPVHSRPAGQPDADVWLPPR